MRFRRTKMVMNSFDESKVRRSTDGKFAHKSHAEGDVSLKYEPKRFGQVTEDAVFDLVTKYNIDNARFDFSEKDHYVTVAGPSQYPLEIPLGKM